MKPLPEQRSELLSVPEPPHPFRTPAWFDPRVEHHPCQCPHCRPKPRVKRHPILGLRIIATVAGGVILPIVSLILNQHFHVVNLESVGTVGLILSVINCLAHLILWPLQRHPETGELLHHPPRSTWLRVALLWSALISALYWGYLALLFIPLLPISVIAILFMGIGLCGLCPYGAFFIAIRQAIRGARSLSRPWVVFSLLSCIAYPVLLGAGLGIHQAMQHRQVTQQIQRISEEEPYSSSRMALIQELEGQEEQLIESYLREADHARRVVIAEVYLRLTDSRLNKQQVEHEASRRGQTAINPWWFLQDTSPLNNSGNFWRL